MTLQVEEQERDSISTGKSDEDAKALKAFIEFRDTYQINYNRISDDDVLVDAMNEAESMDLKRILMRYRRLKNEANLRDH
jgi:hypothetical protein